MARRLHLTRHGVPRTDPRRRVVLAHGFTQTAASWSALAAALAPGFEVLAPDAPGHGGSADVEVADLAGASRLVTAAGGAGVYVGYSMGGRLCLQAALDDPAAVTSLVLVSATAGIEDGAARAARRVADGRLADRLEGGLTLDAFLDEWLAQPLFATLAGVGADRGARRANTPAGLAASLRTCGTGSMEPLWRRLGEIRAPVLVVAGGRDAKFLEIGERLAAGIAGAELAVLPGAGHAVPFEAPAAFEELLRRFLEQAATR